MRILIWIAVVIQAVLGGGSQFSVRLPFLNPAGVTYLDGPAPSGLAAGPFQYGAGAPLQYATGAHLQYAAAPAPLHYEAHAQGHIAYAAPPAYAAVPAIHHVPAVADVPVTRVEAQPGVIQKVVDVAKPAVSTRKFQLRRPAIEKKFYDIEERVIVRPAGSALVELQEPHAKIQKGPAVINPVGVAVAPAPVPVAVAHPVQPSPAPVFVSTTPAPLPPAPAPGSGFGGPSPGPVAFQDEESVVIDNPDFAARSAFAAEGQRFEAEQRAINVEQQHLQDRQQELFARRDHFESQARTHTEARPIPLPGLGRSFPALHPEVRINGAPQEFLLQRRGGPEPAEYSSPGPQPAQYSSPGPQPAQYSSPGPQPAQYSSPGPQPAQYSSPGPQPAQYSRPGPQPVEYSRPGPQPAQYSHSGLEAVPLSRAGPDVVPSLPHQHPDVEQGNQQRLIQLLTARGGVAEVGFGRSGPSPSPVGDSGPVRARVLSATSAPPHAAPAGERVSTRRVVVSRPIETVQDIDVVEPVTKLERVAVNHPTVFKTVHHDVARVPTSVPVVGKALAPAVPIGYGVAPAYGYVH